MANLTSAKTILTAVVKANDARNIDGQYSQFCAVTVFVERDNPQDSDNPYRDYYDVILPQQTAAQLELLRRRGTVIEVIGTTSIHKTRKNGVTYTNVRVKAPSFDLRQAGRRPETSAPAAPAPAPAPTNAQRPVTSAAPASDVDYDDIPF